MNNLENESNTPGFNDLFADKINVKKILQALNFTNIFSAIRWCKKHHLLVIKFGKERFVNKVDFELIIDKSFILALKQKYPNSWKEIYAFYKSENYAELAGQLFSDAAIVRKRFVAQGKAASKFFNNMKTKLQ